jgi:hypothetical protein
LKSERNSECIPKYEKEKAASIRDKVQKKLENDSLKTTRRLKELKTVSERKLLLGPCVNSPGSYAPFCRVRSAHALRARSARALRARSAHALRARSARALRARSARALRARSARALRARSARALRAQVARLSPSGAGWPVFCHCSRLEESLAR